MAFARYLQQFRVEKNKEFSHTGMGAFAGSYFVPSERLDEFNERYASALDDGETISLTEKHKPIGPVVVDVDLRFDISKMGKDRKYTKNHLDVLADIYVQNLANICQLPESFDVFMFEKPSPAVSPCGNVLKDGIHIMIPSVVTRTSVQLLLREKVLEDERTTTWYTNIGSMNSLKDAIDEAVIARNNWMLYGSKKPNTDHAYAVTCVYKCTKQEGDSYTMECEGDTFKETTEDAVNLFSIRNKPDQTHIKNEIKPELEKIETRIAEKSKKNMESIIGTSVNTQRTTINDDDLEVVKKLVRILSVERAEGYESWIRVGWCLRNIDVRLMPEWIEFSSKSPKFAEGECEKKWNYMRSGGLGIGTLHMWAKADNPEEYKAIIRSDLHGLIERCVNMSHYDISRVIYHMFRYQYVCACIRTRTWYEFRNHRWHMCDSGYSLRAKISTEVWKEFTQAAGGLNMRAAATQNEQEQQNLQEKAKRLNDLALKLKNTSFKDNIMKECTELFYTEKFEEKLDSSPHMLCFENGVYDMNCNEFREGRPEDYLSFSTGCNYIPYEADHPIIGELDRFFAQVQPKEAKRTYLLSLFASFLGGHIKDQKFHIWTGSGSNGKSVCVELFEKAIGTYCCKFPITLLTQKRAASNATTSELARAKGRRLAVLQEPSEDEKLQVGLMKELTGGDTIMCRALYKDPIEYKPQYKLILLCNHLPSVPSDDGGTWRRIRVIEFTSKFVDNPKEENEFPIDLELSSKFDSWREHFLTMLLNKYYPMIQHKPIVEPEEVMMCTREYQHNNDHMSHFMNVCIEKHDSGFLSVDESFTELKNWVRDDNVPFKVQKKNEFQKYIEKKLGRCSVIGGCTGWKGYKLRNRYAKPNIEEPSDEIDF